MVDGQSGRRKRQLGRREFVAGLAIALLAPAAVLPGCSPAARPTFSASDAWGAAAADAGRQIGEPVRDAAVQAAENLPSIAKLLRVGLQPVGEAMYVYGGGWSSADSDGGVEATRIGVSPRWAEFADQQGSGYDYHATWHQSHDGLDCSGYMGWTVYNALEHQDNANAGYVSPGESMAGDLAARGFGDYTPAGAVDGWQAGDICSMPEHVWMAVGQCADGSVVVLHCSPPGVFLCGTLSADSNYTQATDLAGWYMQRFYPHWVERFGHRLRPFDYLTSSSRMRWNAQTLPDPHGLRSRDAAGVLEFLFQGRE